MSAPTSDFYQGSSGAAYFAWQRRVGIAGGRIEARKFSPFVRPQDVVVDFGCGTGAMLLSLTCAHGVGVDVNPSARREAAAAGVDVRATLDEVESASADAVVSNHALEHALDPYAVCLEFLRVLRPGGSLVLCLPFDDLLRGRSFDPDDTHHHLFTWTPQTIGNLLSEAGFHDIVARPLIRAWPPGWAWLDERLSVRAFDRLCTLWSLVSRYRQVMVFAVKPGRSNSGGGA